MKDQFGSPPAGACFLTPNDFVPKCLLFQFAFSLVQVFGAGLFNVTVLHRITVYQGLMRIQGVVADLKALPLLGFFDLGLAFNPQATVIDFHAGSVTGRFTASTAAAIARAPFASSTFRGRRSGNALPSTSWGGGAPPAPT